MIDLSAVDSEDLVVKLGLEKVRLTASGTQVNFSCFGAEHSHGDERPSAYISTDSALWFCFAGETQVITKDEGRVEIRDLLGTKQEVLTRGGVWAPTVFKQYGRQRLLKLTLSRNGIQKVIRTTADHRWFAGWSTSDTRYVETTTADLKPKQVLEPVFPNWSPSRSGTKISPIGVMHGFVFGDGNQIKNGCVANFYGEKDLSMRDWFVGASEYISEDRLTLTGMPRSWKKVPGLDEGSQYLYGWLAGYFAADGDVAHGGCASLNSASIENLRHVQSVCDRLGIGTSDISTYSRKGYGETATDIYRVRFFTEGLTPEFFLIPEHRERAEYVKKYERRRWQVVSVEETDDVEVVYCCEVEKTHAFALDGNILTGNCHTCKRRGNAISLVMDVQQVSRATAESQLREWYGIEFNEPVGGSMVAETEARFRAPEEMPPPVPAPIGWLSGTKLDWASATEDPEPFERYMFERGFLPTSMQEWYIGYDYVSDRITIPVFDLDGNLVGVKGRDWTGQRQPKYMILGDRPGKTNYGFDPYESSQVLFGLHRAREHRTVVLCEGELNAIALSQMGVPRPVATGMSYFSGRHAQLIIREAEEVVVFYDHGDAGHAGVWGRYDDRGKFHPAIVQALEMHVRLRIVEPPPEDPAQLLQLGRAGEALALIKNARSPLALATTFV